VLEKHEVWVTADEIYSRLTYGDFVQKSLLEIAPGLRERLIVVDGVSKTFAMTGWRIGWMLASEQVAKACDKIQSQSTTNPTAVAQHAAIAALTGPQEPIEEMRAIFEQRRARIVEGLNAIDGVRCATPDGAFYAFADVRELVGKKAGDAELEDDLALAGYLLDEAKVAVVPGTAFGAPGHLRISYAASEAQIDEGLSRIAAAVAKLS
jgi:aspartate aminotransferase